MHTTRAKQGQVMEQQTERSGDAGRRADHLQQVAASMNEKNECRLMQISLNKRKCTWTSENESKENTQTSIGANQAGYWSSTDMECICTDRTIEGNRE